jgi:hypothetical protein
LGFEQIAYQRLRCLINDDRSRPCPCLKASAQSGSLSDENFAGGSFGAGGIGDDYFARRDANPRPPNGLPVRAHGLGEIAQLQTRADCLLGVILVRHWVTEIDKHDVVNPFGDDPSKAAHRLGYQLHTCFDHAVQILEFHT